ncbi:cutinase family protein [Nocardia takedensis]|uniref:cutinase family protein n=1 Tax=Nocardia takedensis TaxID=259390 RepID=UPI00031D8833|nr:cutinase family protein [Nocardia takedensis]
MRISRGARLGRAIFVVLCAIVTIAPGVAVGEPVHREHCPEVAGVFLPGTWETDAEADSRVPVGLLAPAAQALRTRFGDRFEARFPGYAAVAFDGMPYARSKATGVAAASAAVAEIAARCPAASFLLAGYSQGADAMGDLAATIGCRDAPVAARRVLAVGLIADPRQGGADETLIGPPVPGPGLAGPRAGGFCALGPVTTQICASGDKYCATDTATHPLLSALGQLLSRPSGVEDLTGDPTAGAALDALLASDFADVRLASLAGALDELTVAAGAGDDTRVAVLAGGIAATLRPLRDSARWADRDQTVRTVLHDAPAGSEYALAGEILDAVDRSDLDTALAVLDRDDFAPETTRAVAVATAPLLEVLTASSEVRLRQAWRVLAAAWPSVLVDRLAAVAGAGMRFVNEVPAIGAELTRLGSLIRPGVDVGAVAREMTAVLSRVLEAVNPLLRTANENLFEVSRILGLVPDASGAVSLAAQVVRVAAGVDTRALSDHLSLLREALATLSTALGEGVPPAALAERVAAVGARVAGVVTVALDDVRGVAGAELRRVAESVLAGADAEAVAGLIEEALGAVAFVVSGAHQSYANYVVDADGTTAVQWLARWLTARAETAAG